MDGTNGLKENTRVTASVASTLSVNILSARGGYGRRADKALRRAAWLPAAITPSTADANVSELESSMSSVQIDQKSYEMPPREGISIAHFLTVADIERSARYYEKVFGARILSLGDGNAPGYLQLANIWMILNVGGGPTPISRR